MKHLKKTLLPLAAAALLLVSLAACGSNNADPSTNDGSADTPSSNQEGATGDTVAKEDCSSVYAEIIAVNGSHLSVSAGDQVLDLTVKDDILTKWTQGDQTGGGCGCPPYGRSLQTDSPKPPRAVPRACGRARRCAADPL